MSTILLVDDQPAALRMLTRALERAGFDVTVAGSTEEALGEFARSRPRLVITDIVMPGTSGIELARRLRASAPELPVILVSGHSGGLADAIDEGLRVLPKPLCLEEVVREAEEILGSHRGR